MSIQISYFVIVAGNNLDKLKIQRVKYPETHLTSTNILKNSKTMILNIYILEFHI